ncbi:MAG: hypothetical protein Q7R52_05190 [archaeon]|nr:hypothetical protein [archaeon]
MKYQTIIYNQPIPDADYSGKMGSYGWIESRTNLEKKAKLGAMASYKGSLYETR